MELSTAHNLVNFLNLKREASEEKAFIKLSKVDCFFSSGITYQALPELLRELVQKGLLRFQTVNVTPFGNVYQVDFLEGYDAYASMILDQFHGRAPSIEMIFEPFSIEQAASPTSSGYLALKFDAINRYILLNESFLIAQPAYGSENYCFIEYVWNNPNRDISLEELNSQLDEPLKKSLAKILESLNFRGALKDAFFQVSKTSVRLTPSRSIEELTQAGLYPLRLFSTLSSN